MLRITILKISVLYIFLSMKTVFSDTDSLQKAKAIKMAPCYAEPVAELLPHTYINKNDTAFIEKISVDTAGTPWFKIIHNRILYWTPSSYWKYVSRIDTLSFLEKADDDADKKRRLLILREHKTWPRRIISAIRLGRICIDMDEQQLVASWGEPVNKSKAFTIGLGEHTVWIYGSLNAKMSVVILQNNKVIGWTVK